MTMPHLIGQTVLQYKIVEKLGEGGMGVVYKAEDTKLRRTVALKFLPHDIESHESERARFLQEAQAAALLNHPNICTIHDILEYEGEQFIVMEFVDGKTLRQMVPIQKMQTAIEYAIQIGEALQEAHSNGIVHRDIKTDNIMINSKNQIKVMDFGLAKLRGSLKLTKSRSTVGTLAYMAPEQIQGGEVDARSDIFSFGVVLYEMLTGQLPFKGEHEAGIMYAILNQEPEPLERHVPDTPSELHHILNRALEKEPGERYQSMQELLIDLRRLRKQTSRIVQVAPVALTTALTQPEPKKWDQVDALSSAVNAKRKRVILSLGLLLLVVVSIVTIFVLFKTTHTGVALTRRQLTFVGNVTFAEISPDGKSFAYADDKNRVYIKDIAGGAPLKVFSGTMLAALRWSPDGTTLAVTGTADGFRGVYFIPRFGGAIRRYATWDRQMSWSPDGSTIALTDLSEDSLSFLNVSTGHIGKKIAVKEKLHWIQGVDWSPSGNLIAVLTFDSLLSQRRILTIPGNGGHQYVAVEDSLGVASVVRWSAGGDAIYFVNGEPPNQEITKIEVDRETGKPRGSARVIQVGLPVDNFSVSMGNKRLLGIWNQGGSNLWTAEWTAIGKERILDGRQVTDGTSQVSNAKISSDGNQIAFVKKGPSGTDIHILPFGGGEPRQITFGDRVLGIAWSPNGREISYVSSRTGIPKVYLISAGGGEPKMFEKSQPGPDQGIAWAPGSFILYQLPGNQNFKILNPATEEERPLVTNDSVGWMFSPCWSPDGKSVAVSWSRDSGSGIWLISSEKFDQRQVFQRTPYFPLCWSPDGKRVLLYMPTTPLGNHLPGVLTITTATGIVDTLFNLKTTAADVDDINPSARKIIWTIDESHSDVWLFENFDPDVE
jgi:Tol biopolymer transport system component/predicted Ser/Thr protein kinase